MKERVPFAVILILLGLILFLKNFNLIPAGWCENFMETSRHFWPLLLVLLGVHLLTKERTTIMLRITKWAILFWIGLWVICLMSSKPQII